MFVCSSHSYTVALLRGLGVIAVGACLAMAQPAWANNVAVVVGNSDYKEATLTDLQFADEDARLFAQTLVRFLGYRKEDVRVLTSHPQDGEQEATAANISKAIGDMAQKQADPTQSTFLFFASAHGVETAEGAMLAARDFDPKQALAGAQKELTAQNLTKRLSGLKSGLVVAMLDICRKDGMIRAEQESRRGFVLPQGKAQRVATLFSSSEGPSFESSELKHGYFTYYVCQGLSERKSENGGLPIVGALDETVSGVTLKSLHSYVRWNLLEKTRNLSGAGGMQIETKYQGRNKEFTASIPLSSVLGGQLPELVCGEAVKQGTLAKYQMGTYRTDISLNDRYAVLRNDGIDLYEAKEYEQAGFQFGRAFRVKEDGWAAHAAGDCYSKAGNLTKAESWWDKAIQTDPNLHTAIFNLGLLLSNQGRWMEAESRWRKFVSVAPNDAEANNNLGVVLHNQEKFTEASNCFLKAIEIDPEFSDAMTNLGASYEKQDKLKDAKEWWDRAIKVNPKCAAAMNNLGILFENEGEVKEAESWYRKAIEANNDVGLYHGNLADLLFDTNRKDEALVEAKKAQKLGLKDHPIFELLGLNKP